MVSLCRCHLTIPGNSLSAPSCANPAPVSIIRQKACHALQNNSVGVLFLDGNNFTGDGVHILAGLMHQCPCLTRFSSSHCGITSDDLKQLLEHLTNYKDLPTPNSSKLEYWNLSNNEIDDCGAIALVDHQPSLFPKLGYSMGINFSGNHVSSEIMRRTREEIKGHAEVTYNNYLRYTFSIHTKSSCKCLMSINLQEHRERRRQELVRIEENTVSDQVLQHTRFAQLAQ